MLSLDARGLYMSFDDDSALTLGRNLLDLHEFAVKHHTDGIS